MPYWRRSASVGRRERSVEMAAALEMSSADIPEKSVPQITALATLASGAMVSTADASWNRPWPNSSGRAGVVGHVLAARAGVGCHQDDPVLGRVALRAGLGDEVLLVAGQS